jgi:hypothetical protein
MICILWGCLLLGSVCSGIEKKIVFQKKIIATRSAKAKRAPSTSSDNYLTVWIHGVSFFKPNDYNLGLWPAYTFVENESLFGIGKYLVKSDPIRFPAEDVLMYSWAGKFNYQECEKAAGHLYESLLKAKRDYQARNKSTPKVRIITFSYGGNIALNLAKFKNPHDGLVIDELIILAWPVQNYLVPMTKNPMFKKIFNIYSPLDIVQIIDPQGFICHDAPLFTGRRIRRASNVLQAKVHINGYGRGHFGLNNKQFVSAFPMVLDELNSWYGYFQEHNLGCKRTRYILSIYADKKDAYKKKVAAR